MGYRVGKPRSKWVKVLCIVDLLVMGLRILISCILIVKGVSAWITATVFVSNLLLLISAYLGTCINKHLEIDKAGGGDLYNPVREKEGVIYLITMLVYLGGIAWYYAILSTGILEVYEKGQIRFLIKGTLCLAIIVSGVPAYLRCNERIRSAEPRIIKCQYLDEE